jgi:hypothetical protein
MSIQHGPIEVKKSISRQSSLLPTNSDLDSLPDKMIKPTLSPLARKHSAFIALSTALFLAALDTVLIATALPTIAAQFNINDAGYAWVGSVYLLSVCQNYHKLHFWLSLT